MKLGGSGRRRAGLSCSLAGDDGLAHWQSPPYVARHNLIVVAADGGKSAATRRRRRRCRFLSSLPYFVPSSPVVFFSDAHSCRRNMSRCGLYASGGDARNQDRRCTAGRFEAPRTRRRGIGNGKDVPSEPIDIGVCPSDSHQLLSRVWGCPFDRKRMWFILSLSESQ